MPAWRRCPDPYRAPILAATKERLVFFYVVPTPPLSPSERFSGCFMAQAKSDNGSSCCSTSSLPSAKEMHPSWAARVKHHEAIKVTAPPRRRLAPPTTPIVTQSKVQFSAAARVHIKFDDWCEYMHRCCTGCLWSSVRVNAANEAARSGAGRCYSALSATLLHSREMPQMMTAYMATLAPAKYKSCA